MTGFTLIELLVVMTLLGAMLALGSGLLVNPFLIANDVSRRAALVAEAQTALDRIAREVRRALPNSLRLLAPDAQGRATTLELLLTRGGGRYRRQPAADGSGLPLQTNQPDGAFDLLGALPGAADLDSLGSCDQGSADCLVIYNTDALSTTSPTNAYAGLNRAEVAALDPSGVMAFTNAGGGSGFLTHSPDQRFYIVQGAVTYACTGNQLRRHQGYPLQAEQTGSTTAIGAGSLLAGSISACEFRYRPGDASRNGLLTIRLQLTTGGESVRLLQQVHVLNAP